MTFNAVGDSWLRAVQAGPRVADHVKLPSLHVARLIDEAWFDAMDATRFLIESGLEYVERHGSPAA